jgi:uncharacterized Zn finger protein
MSYWGWKPYVSAAARRAKAASAAARAKKAGAALSPIAPTRGAIARTFWGKAWCDNLERYSDYSNRLPRGRTYVRNGSVIDLAIGEGEVRAQVMGSSLYQVKVRVAAVDTKQWKAIGADCAGSIDSMVELLQGKFSRAVMERLCRPGDGLFPAPKEIEFSCSCPDWASMCKHVAAVLYGVGARLDEHPELLFQLRRVDGNDLIAQAGAGVTRPATRPAKAKVLDDSALADVFGIEMAEAAPEGDAVRPAAGRGSKAATTAAKAAPKGATRPGTKGSSSRAGARLTKTAGAQPSRAAAKAKSAAKARRPDAAATSLPPSAAAARTKRGAPSAAAARQKPKRRSRARSAT